MGWADSKRERAKVARELRLWVLEDFDGYGADYSLIADSVRLGAALELVELAARLYRYAEDLEEEAERFEGMGEPKEEG